MTVKPWRWSDARFLLVLLLPGLTLLNLLQHPGSAFWWSAGTWIFIVVVDTWWPGAQRSPATAGPQPALRHLLRLFVPLQLVLLLAAMQAAPHASWLELAGMAFAVGFVTGGQGITFAHELGHSRGRFDRVLAWVLMASVNYSHFMVEHYRGHHARAATWDDPASARLCCWVLNLALLLLLAGAGQWKMLAFWLGQSAMAIWLLEAVNYVEHYGLTRTVDGDGKRELFGMQHAWNADHVLSNSLLANLQHHSDHHMHAWAPFPELRALPGTQLPTGYAGCLLLAAVPPLWFAAMERRLGATP